MDEIEAQEVYQELSTAMTSNGFGWVVERVQDRIREGSDTDREIVPLTSQERLTLLLQGLRNATVDLIRISGEASTGLTEVGELQSVHFGAPANDPFSPEFSLGLLSESLRGYQVVDEIHALEVPLEELLERLQEPKG